MMTLPEILRRYPCHEAGCEQAFPTIRLTQSHVEHEHRPYYPDSEVTVLLDQVRADLGRIDSNRATPAQVGLAVRRLQELTQMLADDTGAAL